MPAPTNRRFAVCVGINTYTAAGLSDLCYAENDARAMDAVLATLGFPDAHRRLLLGADATTAAINAALDAFILDEADKDDLVVFYFAGHGTPITIKDAPRRSEVFLVPYDFDRAAVRKPSVRTGSALSMERLRARYFEGANGSHKRLFIFDSCHSGDFFGHTYRSDAPNQVAGYVQQMLTSTSTGRVALSSCLPGQQAREEATFQHGLMTYHLLQALQGAAPGAQRSDGTVTIGSVFEYLAQMLPPEQRPVLSGVQHDVFDLATYDPPPTALGDKSSGPTQPDCEATLRACLHDHSGFLNDRLASFVGREAELAAIRDHIAAIQPNGGYVTITGQAGQGKSSVIARLVDAAGPDQVAHHFIPFAPGPDHQVGLLRNVMARLCLKHDLPALYVASDSRPALRDYLPRVLEAIVQKGQEEVIFIDGLDQLEADASGVRDLSFLPLNPPAGIVLVLGTRPNDTLQPLELLKERCEYHLPNLSRGDFAALLQHRGVDLDPYVADRFYRVMEENALYLDLVARELTQQEALDPEAVIARIADNPDNLFSLSIDRLKRHRYEWRNVLKPILGILLVARQPLSVQALRMLTGEDAETIHDGLQRLGGLIQHDGQGAYSLYHLKLYAFLREDPAHPQQQYIFATDEEEAYHARLACWGDQDGPLDVIWQDTPEVREQERRVYARQHYIAHLAEARAYDQLWQVLDTGDYGKAKLRHDLSTRSYALDLDLACDSVITAGHHDVMANVVLLPRLWQYALLRCSLNNQTDHVPDALFPLMVHLGQEQAAIGLAELLTDQLRKVRILIALAEQVTSRAVQQQLVTHVQIIAKAIPDATQCAYALTQLVETLVRQGEVAEARAIVETIPDAKWYVEALIILIKRFVDQGEVAEARAIAGTIPDATQRAYALTQLVETSVRQGEVAEARVIAETIPDATQRAYALTQLVETLVRQGEVAEARAIAETIPDATQRAYALTQLVETLAKQGEVAEARAMAETIPNVAQRAYALSRLIEILITQGEVAEARAIAETIPDVAQRAYALIIFVKWLTDQEGTAEAQAMETIPDQWHQAKALIELSQTLAKQGEVAEARAMAETIPNVAQRAYALSRLIEILITQGEVAEARATAETIPDATQRADVLTSLVKRLAVQGEMAKARAMAETIPDVAQRAYALTQLAELLVIQEDLAQAYLTVEAIFDQGQPSNRLTVAKPIPVIRQELQESTRLPKTLTTHGESADPYFIAQTLPDEAQYLNALSNLVHILVIQGDHHTAATLLVASDICLQTIPHAGWHMDVLITLVETLVTQGAIMQARAIAEAISDEAQRADVLTSLVKRLATQGEVAKARAIAETIPDVAQHVYALTQLVETLARQGEVAAARAIAEAITHEKKRIDTLSHLVQILVTQGEVAEARAIIETLPATKRRTDALLIRTKQLAAQEGLDEANLDEEHQAKALIELSQTLAKQGEVAEARAMAETIPNATQRAYALTQLVETLAKQGEVAEARMMAETITDAGARIKACTHLAHAFVAAHDLGPLLELLQQECRTATTREYLIRLIAVLTPLFAVNRTLATELVAAFAWVDAMRQR